MILNQFLYLILQISQSDGQSTSSHSPPETGIKSLKNALISTQEPVIRVLGRFLPDLGQIWQLAAIPTTINPERVFIKGLYFKFRWSAARLG